MTQENYEYYKGLIEGKLFGLKRMTKSSEEISQIVQSICDDFTTMNEELQAGWSEGTEEQEETEEDSEGFIPPELFDTEKTLVGAIDLLCTTLNASRNELRVQSGVSATTWQNIMKGKCDLRKDVVEKLQRTFNIPDRFFQAQGAAPLNEDGSDPAKDADWIKQRKEESRIKHGI